MSSHMGSQSVGSFASEIYVKVEYKWPRPAQKHLYFLYKFIHLCILNTCVCNAIYCLSVCLILSYFLLGYGNQTQDPYKNISVYVVFLSR